MDIQFILKSAQDMIENSEYNYVSKDDAISEDLVGMKIFEKPVFAVGDANDEGFLLLKTPYAIGEHFIMPNEWLPGASSVISFFLPFTDVIIKSNRKDKHWPSEPWLHGRIEGQRFIKELSNYLISRIVEAGYNGIAPALDSRFRSTTNEEADFNSFSSNWSERHVGYVCGLGTFGLSGGIITEKGMAGRLGSIVTTLKLEPDEKRYTQVYEYCTRCGACVKKCPADAISIETGKDHRKCSELLDITKVKYKPRYGCGKCQISVPCESRIPRK